MDNRTFRHQIDCIKALGGDMLRISSTADWNVAVAYCLPHRNNKQEVVVIHTFRYPNNARASFERQKYQRWMDEINKQGI